MPTVRWGMIGCGSVTEVKSGPGLYKADRSTLLAVASRDSAKARSYAERHKVPRACQTIEELLADPEVDAVYVATPPASHKSLAIAAARAGKHVYLEKPMALDFIECREIIDECRRQQVKLYVAFYRRAMPRFLQVKQWLRDGAIGQPRCVVVVQHQAPTADELTPASLPWRVKPEIAGGGKFLDMGVHVLDLLNDWFGSFAEVAGVAQNLGGLYAAEDTVTAAWRHASGVQGSGSWCYVTDHDRDAVSIIGAKGRIEFEFFSDTPLRLITADGVEERAITNPPHVQQPFIQTIVDDLNGLAPCPSDPESAAHISWVTDQILKGFRKTL
jgi:predicted dehydrogenase